MSKPLRLDVQGLRALAVIAVIIFHMNPAWLPGGFVGVDMFFVISGYLISSILLHKMASGSVDFMAFYKSRLRRIAPAYFATLVATTVAAAVLLTPSDFSYFFSSMKRALLFSSNVYFSTSGDYFSPAMHEQPLLHTWSLAVEMQFYLLLPLLLMLIPRKHLFKALVITIVTLTFYAQVRLGRPLERTGAYFSMVTRIPEFLLGALVAERDARWHQSRTTTLTMVVLGLLCISASLLLITERLPFPGLAALIPCAGTAALLATSNTPVHRFLSLPTPVWVGGLSYSLYLWHWPILSLMRYYTGDHILALESQCLFALVTVVVAMLSYRWIELPFRAASYSQAKAMAATGLAALTLGTSLVAVAANHRIAPTLSDQMTRYAEADQICHGRMLNDCVRGEKNGRPPLLLLGDSHGAQLNIFFDEVGRAQHFSTTIITASSCVPIPDFDVDRIPETSRDDCSRQINAASRAFDSTSTIFLAGKWTFHTQSASFMLALKRYLDKADQQGKKVVVLAQVPMLSMDPQRVERWRYLGLPTPMVTQQGDGIKANELIAALARQHRSVQFLDLTSDGFFDHAPFKDGTLMYFDRHHLNENGAQKYGKYASHHFKKFVDP